MGCRLSQCGVAALAKPGTCSDDRSSWPACTARRARPCVMLYKPAWAPAKSPASASGALKPGDDKLGFIMTAILGVAGSFLANYAGAAMGLYKQGDAAGWIAAVVGSIVLLFVYGLIKSKSA